MRNEQGKDSWELATFYTDAFMEDLAALNIRAPHEMPKASEFIAEQIDLVKMLENKGFTYTTSDGVYFDTSKDDAYGAIASVDLAQLKEGGAGRKE